MSEVLKTDSRDSETSNPTDSSTETNDIVLPNGQDVQASFSTEKSEDPEHSNWIWLHAAYHCLVTIVGTGILGFPHATAYLGYAGATILITTVTAASYYTAGLLTDLQKKNHGTYSELANDVTERPKFAVYTIRSLQFFNFFPTAAVMILIGGQAMLTMDLMANDGTRAFHQRFWTMIMGGVVLLLSMAPDLNHLWQISAVGCLAVFVMTFYCIVGSSEALSDPSFVQDYGRVDDEEGADFVFSLMASFGSIIFGYGFHSLLPDIQASLHEKSSTNARDDMKKAVSVVFSYSYPAYMVVALLGYAAFGSEVLPNVLMSITEVLPSSAMFVVWVFVVIKTACEATVFNQAAFTMVRDTLGMTAEEDHIDHHPTNWMADAFLRVIYVVAATAVAIYVPYFSDLTAITAAISITPMSFVLPVIFWNKKHCHEAPRWRVIFHYIFALAWTLLAVAALVGAIQDIRRQITA